MRIALIAIFVLVAGCATEPVSPAIPADGPVGLNILEADAGFKYTISAWREEASKRLRDPYVFVIHGSTDYRGRWVASGGGFEGIEVRFIARVLHAAVCPRPVVLICCNKEGHQLDVPGVWYARRGVVWSLPDPSMEFRPGYSPERDGVFDIWHFEQGGGNLGS